MSKPFSLETWQQVADYVLTPILCEQSVDGEPEHYWIAMGYGLTDAHFPAGRQRETFAAISDMVRDEIPVHMTTLVQRMKADHSTYWAQLFTVYGKPGQSTLRGRVFEANVQELIRLALIDTDIRVMEQGVQALRDGGKREDVTGQVMSGLAQGVSDRMAGETARDTANEFAQLLDSPTPQMYQLGVAQLDDWINGVIDGYFLAIVAAMKQRKTSLLLNMLLHMARKQEMSVALMMLESSRKMVVANLVAMLAVEWVIERGLYGVPVRPGSGIMHEHISGETLVKIRGRYRNWGDARVQAVDWAIQEWGSIDQRFRIYDKTAKGGALSNCDSLYRVFQRDKMLYGVQFVGIDHAQRVNEPGGDYEKLTKIVPFCETMARAENTTICLLAQLGSDNAKTSNTLNEDAQYTSGARGGTALDEAVDYMFTTGYRTRIAEGERLDETKLLLGLQHSRYSGGGAHMKAVVDIDPYTGLILNSGMGVSLQDYKNGL